MAQERVAILARRQKMPASPQTVWARCDGDEEYLAIERKRGPSWRKGLSMREQTQWDEHAAFMNSLAAQRRVVLGGPVGTGGEILLIMDECQPEEQYFGEREQGVGASIDGCRLGGCDQER